MFTQVYSAASVGVDAFPVRVEADVSDGLPGFSIVGFVSAQVKEAEDRVRTAVKNIGMALPPKRVTINLAPADIRKEGSRFDLPIAAAILAASHRIPEHVLKDTMILGELGLDGRIRPVTGVLSSVIAAAACGCSTCILPLDNLEEGRNVEEIRCIGVDRLETFLLYCCHPESFVQPEPEEEASPGNAGTMDFADIAGQEQVKRAAVLATAGFHNMLMIGPPGSGKTMIASRMPALLPDMTRQECLEVTKIYSVAGLLDHKAGLITRRPFRAPHHTLSPQALAGGGRFPKPGEITLAHRGVLFLDEFPEFSRVSLEILRQPMEDKKIMISRSEASVTFPADFMLIAAMNPCKCGYFPDMNRCRCSSGEISSYKNRISQPLLDRMDLCVEVPELAYEELTKSQSGSTTAEMKAQVNIALEIQRRRYLGTGIISNSGLSGTEIKTYCPMSMEAEALLGQTYRRLGMGARSCHRLIKVARTVADLEGSERIERAHILEACCFRNVEKKFWDV